MISTAAVSVLCRWQDGKLNELYVFVSRFFLCKKMKEFFIYLWIDCVYLFIFGVSQFLWKMRNYNTKKNEFAGHISTSAQILTTCAFWSTLNLPRDHLIGCEDHSEVQHERGMILNAAFVSGSAFRLLRVASNYKVTLMLLHSH